MGGSLLCEYITSNFAKVHLKLYTVILYVASPTWMTPQSGCTWRSWSAKPRLRPEVMSSLPILMGITPPVQLLDT